MSVSAPILCRTFGRWDFIRVPLPAAKMTTWISLKLTCYVSSWLVWLFDQFIALDDFVNLLRGQAQSLADLACDLPFGVAAPIFCYLTK